MDLAGATQQWLPGDLLDAVRRGGGGAAHGYAGERFLLFDVEGEADRLLDGLLTLSLAPGELSRTSAPEESTASAGWPPSLEPLEWCDGEDEDTVREARRLLEWAGARAAFVVPLDSMQELLFSGRVAVGRSLDTNLVLRDSSVSRLHAWIECAADGVLWLHDAGSKNGCWVNGERVQGRAPFSPGDRLRFGRVEALVCSAAALSTALQSDRG